MEFLAEYGLFLAQVLTVVLAIGAIVVLVAAVGQRNRGEGEGHLEIRRINDGYRDFRDALRDATRDPALRKEARKADKKREKQEAKDRSKATKKQLKSGDDPSDEKPRLYILDFDGCRLPDAQVLGEVDSGFDVMNEWLYATRLTVAAF